MKRRILVIAAALIAPFISVLPASATTVHLGTAYSNANYTGNVLDLYGSTCGTAIHPAKFLFSTTSYWYHNMSSLKSNMCRNAQVWDVSGTRATYGHPNIPNFYAVNDRTYEMHFWN